MGAHSETPLKKLNSTGQCIITDELPKQNKYCVYNLEDNFFPLLYYHSKNINSFFKRSTLHYYSDSFGDTESRIPQLGLKKGATFIQLMNTTYKQSIARKGFYLNLIGFIGLKLATILKMTSLFRG